MHSWDDFFWPAIALHDPAHWTLTLLESYFSAAFPVPFLMAAAMLTMLPVLTIYALVARFFIRGIGAIIVQL
jgi:ABC-type glycerol-3-phosphate transport system permease component